MRCLVEVRVNVCSDLVFLHQQLTLSILKTKENHPMSALDNEE